ncbi:MAG: hypothetical protein U0793_13980 [Gemmataceae bacterium]
MNRNDLQQLAQMRLAEAEALLAAGHPAGAYYLAGYAVECALKACIAKGVQQHDFPDLKRVSDSWVHNLVRLVKTAGLELDLGAALNGDTVFDENWVTVKDWKEWKRYDPGITAKEAEDLITAIKDQAKGILPWIVQRW